MEYIDICDENNNPTEEIKEKTKAHEEGDFHRTAHIPAENAPFPGSLCAAHWRPAYPRQKNQKR